MAKKRFVDTMDRMLARTPKESLKGTVVVDQVYARYQHENPHFFHPDGGEPFYLRAPLFANLNEYMNRLGRGAMRQRIQTEMRDITEDLSNEVYERAPLDFADLKASGHPIVERDGRVVYDRPPMVHRLTEEELDIKHYLQRLYEPDRYKR